MRFDIITIFPEAFKSYFAQSILWRAQDKKFVKINIHNLRDWAIDKHRKVDERPYGGGAGMIMKVEPIFKAVSVIKCKAKSAKRKTKVILFSAKGKKFDQKMAQSLSKFSQLIFICGHYEGVDERVAESIADIEISIGDYVLTGGELPAMVVTDAITRLIPGVIKEESLKEESFSSKEKNLEYPQYTRPEVFKMGKKNLRVPEVLLSGHHEKIKEWRAKKSR